MATAYKDGHTLMCLIPACIQENRLCISTLSHFLVGSRQATVCWLIVSSDYLALAGMGGCPLQHGLPFYLSDVDPSLPLIATFFLGYIDTPGFTKHAYW
jgi:hypothetical protein